MSSVKCFFKIISIPRHTLFASSSKVSPSSNYLLRASGLIIISCHVSFPSASMVACSVHPKNLPTSNALKSELCIISNLSSSAKGLTVSIARLKSQEYIAIGFTLFNLLQSNCDSFLPFSLGTISLSAQKCFSSPICSAYLTKIMCIFPPQEYWLSHVFSVIYFHTSGSFFKLFMKPS
jgi:hypothetical protein